jgi:molybdate transport system substrate-binding protein
LFRSKTNKFSWTDSNPVLGGASGIHFAKMLDRSGIADEMKAKTVFPKIVQLEALSTNGEAEIGVQRFQGLVSVAGIEIVGPLPEYAP